jgi:hypothetical protein
MQIFGLDNYFYHGSIRKYIALFGSIFTDIHIKRVADDGSKEEVVKIPIRYGNGNMYIKVPQDESREIAKHSRILPAMAFELDDFYKDDTRKTNALNRLQSISPNSDGMKGYQFNRVPYSFDFELIIRTKNTDDMTQIVEQIVPAFDGNLSASIIDVSGIDIEQDIIITLNDIHMQDNFDDGMQVRLIEWKIKFTLKGHLYKRTRSAYAVKEIDLVDLFGDNLNSDMVVVDNQSPIQNDILMATKTSEIIGDMSTPIKKVTRKKQKV